MTLLKIINPEESIYLYPMYEQTEHRLRNITYIIKEMEKDKIPTVRIDGVKLSDNLVGNYWDDLLNEYKEVCEN